MPSANLPIGKGFFRTGAVTHLATYMSNDDTKLGATLSVIVAALLCEYFEQVAIPPAQLVLGLCRDLASHPGLKCLASNCSLKLIFPPAPVQDACVLSALRIAANCEEIPEIVMANIQDLSRSSGRYIRRVCCVFLGVSLLNLSMCSVVNSFLL